MASYNSFVLCSLSCDSALTPTEIIRQLEHIIKIAENIDDAFQARVGSNIASVQEPIVTVSSFSSVIIRYNEKHLDNQLQSKVINSKNMQYAIPLVEFY